MMINKERFKMSFAEVLFLVAAALYMAGIRYWFPVCMPMENGFMSCHWAGEVLKALSILILVFSLIHIFMPDIRIKAGMNAVLAGISVLMPLIPGKIISVCGNEMMKCRQGTSTWTLVFAAVFVLILVIDTVLGAASLSSEKHKRR